MFFTAASSISCQPSFQNKGFVASAKTLTTPADLIQPDYATLIPKMSRRRMTDVLRMSIVCARDCLQQAAISQPDAIIVGTSMGCCQHTSKFLDKIIQSNETGGRISPTSFMLSTHNTIAGQISLMLGNHAYNMTHTQNSLSVEQALMDARLCLNEGKNEVLVGGAEEEEAKLYNLEARLNQPDLLNGAGTSFFILSNSRQQDRAVRLVDVMSNGLVQNTNHSLSQFCLRNELDPASVDMVLFTDNRPEIETQLYGHFPNAILRSYLPYSGYYMTSSAFACHYAVDLLEIGSDPLTKRPVRKVMICNHLVAENLGLMLLEITDGMG